jgi:hypothetical protein
MMPPRRGDHDAARETEHGAEHEAPRVAPCRQSIQPEQRDEEIDEIHERQLQRQAAHEIAVEPDLDALVEEGAEPRAGRVGGHVHRAREAAGQEDLRRLQRGTDGQAGEEGRGGPSPGRRCRRHPEEKAQRYEQQHVGDHVAGFQQEGKVKVGWPREAEGRQRDDGGDAEEIAKEQPARRAPGHRARYAS